MSASDAAPVETPAPLTRREALALERAALAGQTVPSVANPAAAAPAATVPAEAAPAAIATPESAPAASADPVSAASSGRATVAVRPRRVPVAAGATRASSTRASSTRASSTRASSARASSTARAAAKPDPRVRASKAARRLRAAAVPALAFVASALFFSSNVTPATASDLGGTVVQTSAAAPVPGQTLAASLVVLTVSERDAFVVKDAPPPPPPPPPVVESETASGTSNATSTRSGGVAAGGGTIVNSGTGDIRWPFPGTVVLSSGFGPRAAPCAACSSMHMGLDMTPGSGTPIGAVAAGTVRTSGLHAQFGQYAVIDHVIDGQKVSTLYAHMVVGSSPLVVGQQVAVGELVGLVGRSGVATGAHLHFEVLIGGSTQVDPRAWLDANAGRTL
ncbi:peptidoglycan DD-metalloendopeptidase family protein [Frigoribacterium faeni]|uniref:peptidoglycan DD-metalloendopeptidase family protein n=1 Tax=Frigoribacterium faeni TaxID=145483 RepID=UPI00141B3626|nr:murein DD-endopeptidase MepM/ murein hydrolase activator NlpD [Frigoribacterium faeni]